MMAELSTCYHRGRINRHALAVDVRPARHHVGRSADVDLVSHSPHAAIPGGDPDRILCGAVMPPEERQLLGVLEVAVGTVRRKMPDLRLRRRTNAHERQSTQKVLHGFDSGKGFERLRSFTNQLRDLFRSSPSAAANRALTI